MTRLVVDAAMRDKLSTCGGLVEIFDEAGQLLGFFNQARPPSTSESCESPFSIEEIQRRRTEKGGRSLGEILKDLGAA